jgi:hypothetical protein
MPYRILVISQTGYSQFTPSAKAFTLVLSFSITRRNCEKTEFLVLTLVLAVFCAGCDGTSGSCGIKRAPVMLSGVFYPGGQPKTEWELNHAAQTMLASSFSSFQRNEGPVISNAGAGDYNLENFDWNVRAYRPLWRPFRAQSR